ncbi:MAG: Cof-type HAD-IIB family hydrolase [Treponema sp.]|jgi:Cof subfamily protein (haloacid dehalogenase superfamily)|nr:Cof-type HAD-IIB family hydrolase [Treponema sp.]
MNKKPDPYKIKALALDLDGTTLLPDTTLGERTVKILKTLISKSIQIIIATGRAMESSEIYRSVLGTQGPMVFFNGAVVADVPSNKILYLNMLGLDVVNFGTDIAREMDYHYQLYMPAGISPFTGEADTSVKWGMLLIEKECQEADKYRQHTGITPVIQDFKKIIAMPGLKGCVKAMYICDPVYHDDIRKKFIDKFGGRINVMRSSPTFLEILNSGVTKGEGLRIAMEHRRLKPDEVIAFGDEENDLSMFSVAGFSAAPISGKENVRNAADIIYGSAAEEGLAGYLEDLFRVML